jgi:hypothetical protein
MHTPASAIPEDDTPLPAGTTRADFWSGRYCISGDVTTGARRLLDHMRDTSRQYIDLRRVRIRPSDAPDQVTDAADGLLAKPEIDWVAVRAEPSRAESRLYAFVKKTPVRVKLVLASHVIEGSVFIDSAATDPVNFFLRGIEKSTERYLAVGGATITGPNGNLDATGLAIVNRSTVRLFSVIREPS